MARIDIKQTDPSNAYGTGELKLQSNALMTATLTLVTDNLNTASQLKLSTTLTQVAGTLQIAKDGGSYIDAQDTTGIDRFNVNRDSSSQQVNIDFASLPTDLTTAVGAIRTATDGVNLANVMTFLENGNIGIRTSAATSALTLLGNNAITFTGVSAQNQTSSIQTDINDNMAINFGSGSGKSLVIGGVMRFSSNAVIIGSTGNPSATLQVKGSGSTSATTSLLVQNSAGNTSLQVRDNSSIGIGDGFGGGDGIRLDPNGGNPQIVFRAGIDRITMSRTGGDQLSILSQGGTPMYIGSSGISTDGGDTFHYKWEGANNLAVAFDATRYIKVNINGVVYKLALCV